jgi:hypothetical protein
VSQHISTLFGTKLNRGKAKSFDSNRVAIDLELSTHVAVEAEFVLKCSVESLCSFV